MLPSFIFVQISPLSHFWSSLIEIEVLNEEEYSILHILCCYSLQQNVFLALCNDYEEHYHMFAFELLRNKILFSRNDVKNQHDGPLLGLFLSGGS